jgi:hypothetical protein
MFSFHLSVPVTLPLACAVDTFSNIFQKHVSGGPDANFEFHTL